MTLVYCYAMFLPFFHAKIVFFLLDSAFAGVIFTGLFIDW